MRAICNQKRARVASPAAVRRQARHIPHPVSSDRQAFRVREICFRDAPIVAAQTSSSVRCAPFSLRFENVERNQDAVAVFFHDRRTSQCFPRRKLLLISLAGLLLLISLAGK